MVTENQRTQTIDFFKGHTSGYSLKHNLVNCISFWRGIWGRIFALHFTCWLKPTFLFFSHWMIMSHFSPLQIFLHRLHYLMTHNNYLRIQSQPQPFTWHVGWILQRFFTLLLSFFKEIIFIVEMSEPLSIADKWYLFLQTGFSFCPVSCPCTCRIDVAAKFCNTNRLAKQNDTV
jgi:hypothetical protein